MKDKELRDHLFLGTIISSVEDPVVRFQWINLPEQAEALKDRVFSLEKKIDKLLELLEIEEIKSDCKKKLKMGDKEVDL